MSRAAVARNAPSVQKLVRMLHDAVAAQRAGQIETAAKLYGAVLRQRPDEFNALHMLGLIEYQRGRLLEAIRLITAALQSEPNSADAWSNLGLVLHAQDDYAKALDAFDRALALKPDHAEVLNNRGTTLNCLERHEDALESFTRAVALRPDYLFARFNQGSTLLGLGRFAEALASFEATLAIAPNHADTLCHRGNVLLKLNRLDEAFASYSQALAIAPDHPQILQNYTVALRHLGRPREALESSEKALRIKPDYAAARFEQAIALLALGDFERGWAAYESRWQLAEFEPQRRNYGRPHWLGQEDIAGKTILLHCEQGYGDTLQFVRYAPLLAARGATVVLEVQEHLKALLSQMPGVSSAHVPEKWAPVFRQGHAQDEKTRIDRDTFESGSILVIARGEPLPPFDLYCPLLSLPLAFGTRCETIPANVPYIAADRSLAAHWAAKLSDFAGKTKIGLVWAGNSSANAIDTRRSLSLSEFAPLAELPGTAFFSLQKGEPAAQAQHPPEGFALTDFSSELHGFEDTAALIANLDLVISVDTSVAHLAGAMAKPVFILSRFDGCWRWLNHRDDSPWYPTARLFHQKGPGAWDEVIARLRQTLKG